MIIKIEREGILPYEKEGKGWFTPDGKRDNRRFTYQIDSWVKEGEFPRRRSGKRIGIGDLHRVDSMVVKSTPEDEPENSIYSTVWGPFDDWDFLEGLLAYDYGDEGSMLQVAASK